MVIKSKSRHRSQTISSITLNSNHIHAMPWCFSFRPFIFSQHSEKLYLIYSFWKNKILFSEKAQFLTRKPIKFLIGKLHSKSTGKESNLLHHTINCLSWPNYWSLPHKTKPQYEFIFSGECLELRYMISWWDQTKYIQESATSFCTIVLSIYTPSMVSCFQIISLKEDNRTITIY